MSQQPQNINRLKAKFFKALSDPVRIEILAFLRDGEKCVCEIIPHVGLIQPVVSRHLKILKAAGLVKYRKNGNWRLYSITDSRVHKLIDDLTPELVSSLTKRIVEQIA